MNIKRYINLITALLLTGFIGFSVKAAFMGAQRAQTFFNSTPITIFWSFLLVVLIAGFFVYASLRKRFALRLIHLGCILVLAGGMYGSQKGHILLGRFLQTQSLTKGKLSLRQGQSSDLVVSGKTGEDYQLPFSILLKEAFIEYYDEPAIGIHFSDGVSFKIPAVVGSVFQVPDHRGTIQIIKVYRNFKLKRQNDDRLVPFDSPEPGSNRAYELVFTPTDGAVESNFVFERFPMHAIPGQTFHAGYIAPAMVKDYKSTLQILDDGQLVKEVTIEVNKPLYYSGYHLYQSTFGYDEQGVISGIMLTSARGVWIVFAGYAMIFVGLVSRFWHKSFKEARQ